MSNKPTFTKGQAVYLIQSWDGKGTFCFQKLIVGSCGQKQMHLMKQDGKTLAERVYMDHGRMTNNEVFAVFAATEDFNPEVTALEMATAFIPFQTAYYQGRIAHFGGDRYIATMQKEIAALHAPRAFDRDVMDRDVAQ